MTTKQILLSALILGAINNNVLAMESSSTDKVFKDGWYNKLNDEYLKFAILNPRITKLNHIKIIEKCYGRFHAINTIGKFKKDPDIYAADQATALQHIASNNAILCGPDTILLNSTDPNDCEMLRNEYENFQSNSFLKKKNNTTT